MSSITQIEDDGLYSVGKLAQYAYRQAVVTTQLRKGDSSNVDKVATFRTTLAISLRQQDD